MSKHRLKLEQQFQLKAYFREYHSGLYQFMCLSQNKLMKYRCCKKSEIICFKLQFELIFYIVFFSATPSDRKIDIYLN